MKTMFTKCRFLLVAGLMATTFFACGGGEDDDSDNTGGSQSTSFSIIGTWRYDFRSNDTSRGMVYNLVTFNADHTGYVIEEVGYGSDYPESFTWRLSDNTIAVTYSNGMTQNITFTMIDANTVRLNIPGIGNNIVAYRYEEGIGSGNGGSSSTDTKGSATSPFTPAEANAYGWTLAANEESAQEYYIRGVVKSIKEAFGTQYGNATFYIASDTLSSETFYIYRAHYLEDTKYAGQDLNIRVGDDVLICGKITNYNGSLPETVQEKAYVVSINGVTRK